MKEELPTKRADEEAWSAGEGTRRGGATTWQSQKRREQAARGKIAKEKRRILRFFGQNRVRSGVGGLWVEGDA